MNKSRIISVVIVNWNGKKWIKKCLDSLLNQTYKNFEIILVDNASTDDSIKFTNENYPGVRIVENAGNYGFAKGNNVGIGSARGDYILLLNNDTWVEPFFLEEMVFFYDSHDYDVIAPAEAKYSGEKVKSCHMSVDLLGHPAYNKSKTLFYLPGICLFFEKDLYEQTNGLDDDFFMYFEETDWFWRLNLLKKKIGIVYDTFVFHAGAGSSGTGLRYLNFLWRNQNALQMLLKNYAWYNLLWVLPIYFVQNIFEIVAFSIIFKPKIAYSYVGGWWFNVVSFKKTMQKRKWIQENRKIGDVEVMKKMYFGFAKISHLFKFYKKNG